MCHNANQGDQQVVSYTTDGHWLPDIQDKSIRCLRKEGRGEKGRKILDDLRVCFISLHTAHLARRDSYYKKKQKFLK